jgi:hypothetical protein
MAQEESGIASAPCVFQQKQASKFFAQNETFFKKHYAKIIADKKQE